MKGSLVAAFSLASLVTFAPLAADAKPPAYTMANVGFTTSLHAADSCDDDTCAKVIPVLEGASKHRDGAVKILIREHKRRAAGREAIVGLARDVLEAKKDAVTVRVVSGKVGDHSAVEAFSVEGGCKGELVGRVFLALGGKSIEIETRAPMGDADANARSLDRMQRVLAGVRIHRLGDHVLDPSGTRLHARELEKALPKECKAKSSGG